MAFCPIKQTWNLWGCGIHEYGNISWGRKNAL